MMLDLNRDSGRLLFHEFVLPVRAAVRCKPSTVFSESAMRLMVGRYSKPLWGGAHCHMPPVQKYNSYKLGMKHRTTWGAKWVLCLQGPSVLRDACRSSGETGSPQDLQVFLGESCFLIDHP
jgi:hypothetical protein